MPKQQYTIRSFSGGINTVKDPRDLAESEVSRIDNMSIDAQGKIKSAGAFNTHDVNPSNPGGSALTKYISTCTASLDNRSNSSPGTATGRSNKGGGFNLFYFECDHSRKNEFNDDNTATFTVGTTDDSRNVWFVNPQNSNVTSNAATPAGDAPASGSSSSL